MLKLSVLVLAVAIGACTAVGPIPSSFFPATNFLECNVPNPLAGNPDQPDTKPSGIPVLRFRIVYKQFGVDNNFYGSYFQPVPSGFNSPVIGEFSGDLRDYLLDAVGDQINPQLSSPGANRPMTMDEATAGELIPLRINTTSNTTGDIVIGTQSREAEIREILNELGVSPVDQNIIVRGMGELNSRCRPIGDWVRLPVGEFYPEWIYTSFCRVDLPCSLPGGLACEPVVSADSIAHSVFLHWDCCWSLNNRRWEWECGWRRVRIAFLVRCYCGCGVVFQNLEDGSYMYTGGVAEPSFVGPGRLPITVPAK